MLKVSALAAIIFIFSFSEFALATRTYRAFDRKKLKSQAIVQYLFGEKFRLYQEFKKSLL